ncbi:hypothetical protein JXC34_01675 [Candidatus Woesearchaeota archaeon]|nr:hypothetical protein [Candidatus Woesearchaeota archaeon]
MGKLRQKIALIISIFLSVSFVAAQQTRLSDAVRDLQMLDIVRTYATIPSLVDFILLYMLFLHVFRHVLKKREFPKPIAIVLAVIAAISGVIGLNEINTNLIMFARLPLYLGFGYLILTQFTELNQKMKTGLGLLVFAKLLEFLESTMPQFWKGFPFFALIKAAFLIGGFIMTAVGFAEMFNIKLPGLPGGKDKKAPEVKEPSAEELADAVGAAPGADENNPPPEIDKILDEFEGNLMHLIRLSEGMKKAAIMVLEDRKRNPTERPASLDSYLAIADEALAPEGYLDKARTILLKFFEEPANKKRTGQQAVRLGSLLDNFNRVLELLTLIPVLMYTHYEEGEERQSIIEKIGRDLFSHFEAPTRKIAQMRN